MQRRTDERERGHGAAEEAGALLHSTVTARTILAHGEAGGERVREDSQTVHAPHGVCVDHRQHRASQVPASGWMCMSVCAAELRLRGLCRV